MDSVSYHEALAQLAWQVELGVNEAMGDTALDRYALAEAAKAAAAAPAPIGAVPAVGGRPATAARGPVGPDPVAEAEKAAQGAGDLDALRAAMAAYPHCELQRGATNLVFSDGVAGAPLMIVGEAPGREEDRQGKPFVGRAGQLLDRMLEAIGRARSRDVYITNVLPWRPPQNRDPEPEEIAMLRPFLLRHIALAEPKVLIAMGNISCQALLGWRGITRLRGTWDDVGAVPVMPTFHPAYLLRNPAAKRQAWADLLDIQARLG